MVPFPKRAKAPGITTFSGMAPPSHIMRAQRSRIEAGLALIEEATSKSDLTTLRRARQVRNGVMIALLALCPIRLKNFAALELQSSFRRVGTRWWIVLDRKDTKNRRPDERRVPRDLDAAIEAYLLVHRPVLAAANTRTSVEFTRTRSIAL